MNKKTAKFVTPATFCKKIAQDQKMMDVFRRLANR
jgi:hypothetical protein